MTAFDDTEPSAQLLRDRAIASLRNGKLDQALMEVGESIRLDRRGAEGYFLRSTIYRAMGDRGEGIENWLDAVSLDPTLSDVNPLQLGGFTFVQRPLGELPKGDDLAHWLDAQDADYQWTVVSGKHLEQVVLVNGNEFTVWQDTPLTDNDELAAAFAYAERAAPEEFEANACEFLDTIRVKY